MSTAAHSSAGAASADTVEAALPSTSLRGTASLRGRQRVLDGAWLLTGLALALVVGMLDGLDLIEIPLASFLTSVAGFSLIYLAGSLWVQARPDERARERALVWLQVLAIGSLGALWLQVGGVAVPAIAVLFLLPIATSGMALSRWHPVVSALAVIVVVGGVAVVSSPDARAFAGSHGLAFPVWLASLADRSAALGGTGFFTGAAGKDTATVLVVFLVVAVGVGLVSTRLSDVASTLDNAVSRSSGAVVAAHDFADTLFDHAPDPFVLIDPASGVVTRATRSFTHRFGEDQAGGRRTFLDMVGFHMPDQVRPALRGGDVPPTPHSSGGAFGVSSLKVRPVTIDGRDMSLIAMTDQSLVHKVLTALDADPDLLILLDGDDRVAWLNAAAREEFGVTSEGNRAGNVLEFEGLPSGWWDPGPREAVRRPLRIGEVDRNAELRASQIPGTRQRLIWIRVNVS